MTIFCLMPENKVPYISLGINMAAGMGIFVYGGYLLDDKGEKGQFWTLIGTVLGLFYCGYEIWKLIRELNQK